MIVSPYDPANPSPHSQTTCLLVKESKETSGSQSRLCIHTVIHVQLKTSNVVIVGIWCFCANQAVLSVPPRTALQIWLHVITRHSRLGADVEESSVDHPQIFSLTRVSVAALTPAGWNRFYWFIINCDQIDLMLVNVSGCSSLILTLNRWDICICIINWIYCYCDVIILLVITAIL